MDISESWVVRILDPIRFRCYAVLVKASYDHVLPPYFMLFPMATGRGSTVSVWKSWQNYEKRLLPSSCLPVPPSVWNNSAPTGRIFMKFNTWFYFFRKSVKKIQVPLKADNNNEYFTCRPHIHFFLYLAQFFLEWETFQTKVVEKIKTHILCTVTFFSENHAVYGIMWKNMLQPDRSNMTIWRMRIAWCIPKAKITHSEYVIHTAFLLQQWLQARFSLLCCMYTTVSILDVKYSVSRQLHAAGCMLLSYPYCFTVHIDTNCCTYIKVSH